MTSDDRDSGAFERCAMATLGDVNSFEAA